MKALRQLGFLKLNLRPEVKPEDDHRVLELFRNRAELKKAYGELQEETFRLKDLIKQQEGATQRAQEMLSALEGRLGTTASAYPALVFYQLRKLWQAGRELITRFVADLARQQEERERRAHLAQHNRRQFQRRQVAQNKVQTAQGLHAEANAQLAALEQERATLKRFWHYFRRRTLVQKVAAAEVMLESAASSLGEAQLELEEVERESAPEFPGLSLAARRSINLAAVAYAEVLCLRLTEIKTPLVGLAREATGRRECGDDYGSPKECVLLMGQIARAHSLLDERGNLAQEIRVCTERLKRVARYRSANDSTPQTDSIAFSEGDILEAGPLGSVAGKIPNVLDEDTWDLFRILLR
jgi:hypothetical protein